MLRKELALFDKAAFGVMGINAKGEICYSNRWIRKLLRARVKSGTPLVRYVSDPTSLKKLEGEAKRRLKGHPGQYEIALNVKGQRTKVEVFGTPVRGSTGKVTGSVTFVTNASLDKLRDSILNISVSVAQPLDALDKLRILLEPYFSFDFLAVSLYDEDLRHMRVLYFYARESDLDPKKWDKHWVALSRAQRLWIESASKESLAIPDVIEFMKEKPWCDLQDDPMFVELEKLGIKSSGSIFVKDRKRIVASISLISKRSATYDEQVLSDLEELPISRCVLSAVNTMRNADVQLRYRLIRLLAKCQNAEHLAQLAVKLLRRQFKLSRVGVYSVTPGTGMIKHRAECDMESDGLSTAPFQNDLLMRAVSQVAQSKSAIYLPTLGAAEDDKAGSAFVWPVLQHDQSGLVSSRWVFFATDVRNNAFSPPERKAMAGSVSDIGALFEWMTELELVQKTIANASDAIVVVDSQNVVRRTNDAAVRMFGPNRDLASYFADPKVAAGFLEDSERTGEAQVRKATGAVVPAIVRCNPLPDPIGGKVFTFEDIENFKRLEDLGFLGQVATEIATQVQTPLMLASSWTHRMEKLAAESGNEKQIEELAKRTQAQLRRIQSCLDRIAVYRSIEQIKATLIPIDLESELGRVVDDLPESDRDRIQFRHPAAGIQVKADPGHVSFVFDTLIAYLLRDLPNSQKIRVSMGHHEKGGWFDCKVNWPEEESPESIADANALPMLLEHDLVKSGLGKILGKYGGSLTFTPPNGRRVSQARVELPLS